MMRAFRRAADPRKARPPPVPLDSQTCAASSVEDARLYRPSGLNQRDPIAPVQKNLNPADDGQGSAFSHLHDLFRNRSRFSGSCDQNARAGSRA